MTPLQTWTGRILVKWPSTLIAEWLAPFVWISPNGVTVVSFMVAMGAVQSYWVGRLSLGAAIWLLSFILDGVDGKLARLRAQTSRFGALLDNLLDKIKKAATIFVLTVVTVDEPLLFLPWIGLHYAFQWIPYRRSERVNAFLARHRTLELFHPCDSLMIICVLGPLFDLFSGAILVCIFLQAAQVAIHLAMSIGERSANGMGRP